MDFSDWWLLYLLWNCHNMNVTGLHWWSVNIGSGNGLVLSGNKPLHEPMLTQISVACRHMVSLGHSDLNIVMCFSCILSPSISLFMSTSVTHFKVIHFLFQMNMSVQMLIHTDMCNTRKALANDTKLYYTQRFVSTRKTYSVHYEDCHLHIC